MTDLSVWQKSPESIENREISAASPFSFWVIEPKEKRVLGGIFKKVNSGEEKVIRATSFVMKLIVKSFNFEKLTKLRKKKDICTIQDFAKSLRNNCEEFFYQNWRSIVSETGIGSLSHLTSNHIATIVNDFWPLYLFSKAFSVYVKCRAGSKS